MLTVNLGGYSVWHQMVNKPQYFKSWQALNQAFNTIYSSNFLDQFYGYNALNFFFNNQDAVNQYVLNGIKEED